MDGALPYPLSCLSTRCAAQPPPRSLCSSSSRHPRRASPQGERQRGRYKVGVSRAAQVLHARLRTQHRAAASSCAAPSVDSAAQFEISASRTLPLIMHKGCLLSIRRTTHDHPRNLSMRCAAITRCYISPRTFSCVSTAPLRTGGPSAILRYLVRRLIVDVLTVRDAFRPTSLSTLHVGRFASTGIPNGRSSSSFRCSLMCLPFARALPRISHLSLVMQVA